jgi:hypothetical protein
VWREQSDEMADEEAMMNKSMASLLLGEGEGEETIICM